jgi:hypothetical protein
LANRCIGSVPPLSRRSPLLRRAKQTACFQPRHQRTRSLPKSMIRLLVALILPRHPELRMTTYTFRRYQLDLQVPLLSQSFIP